MKRQWTEQEINEWYAKQPWLRGTNFLPSDCINRLDMWQSFGREEHLKTAETELKLSEETGFNTVRLWCNFDVYYKEPEEFMQTLESYISLCAKYHHSVMLVLAYEEDLPYGDKFAAKELGAQKEYYNHFNRDYELQDKLMAEHAYKHYTEYPEIKPIFMEMVERVVKKYRADNRILAWNIENEPGAAIGERSIPLLRELFALVRSLDPVQPLAADVYWGVRENGELKNEVEKTAYALSDFISFHSYSKYEKFLTGIYTLKKYFRRPIIVTEWLNRCNHNTVQEIYPLMMIERVGCYCWGFVQGKTYTTEPWDGLWKKAEENPLYGKIVCRCESVTEGEIVDSIVRPLGAVDPDGVKRRTRAGMGRCQSDFCFSRVAEILSEKLGIPAEKLRFNANAKAVAERARRMKKDGEDKS